MSTTKQQPSGGATLAQQEPVAKMGMYEHKCPDVTGHRGPSFVCQKAGHGVGQNSYCNVCTCPEALNTSPQPAQQEPDAFVPREAIRTLSGGANHIPATLTLNDDGGKAVAVFLSPQPAQVAKPRKRTWVSLTDEEFRNFATTNEYGTGGLIKAIEANLKAKNFA